MKRFTDTEQWLREWFLCLDMVEKLVWHYLCTRCDISGLYKGGSRAASMLMGITEPEYRVAIDKFIELGKVVRVDKGIWLTGFVKFQYGDLNFNNNMHKGVIKQLDANQLQDRSELSWAMLGPRVVHHGGAPARAIGTSTGTSKGTGTDGDGECRGEGGVFE